jgi:spiro-SPASM protein
MEQNEALSFVQKLVSLFPQVYVETIRVAGEEDAVERFYRAWKAGFPTANNLNNSNSENGNSGPAIIIQKYSTFCGFLPQKQAVDLSPVERRPCWHLMRDFPVLVDGTVPLCREDVRGTHPALGNVWNDDLAVIWKNGEEAYLSHCRKEYRSESCGICDEYYTFNF